MQLTKTVFAPFALAMSAALLLALAAAERPSAAHARAIKNASIEKALEHALDRLVVPVQGLTPAELSDNWGAARSDGRRHQGIDIMAAQGTPVVAAAAGRIVRFWNSELGGVSIYQTGESGRLIYYYAHLDARAGGLEEGDVVQQGDVIGYVGATGNATTPHLHFEIQRVADARHWWRGRAVNPYPYLVSGETPD